MTALFNFFLTAIFSSTLMLMGGCSSEGSDQKALAPGGEDIPILVSNLNGAFKIDGENYSLSGSCKGDGAVSYKIGANPEATVPCTDGVWEVFGIIPTLDNDQGGSKDVSEGDKVPVKVSFIGSGGTAISVEGTFTIDRTAPLGGDVAAPESKTYLGGDLDFVVSFDEKVFVDVTSGVPSLSLALETFGAVTSSAKYVSGSGTTELTFRYGIQSGDQDTDGVGLSGFIELNSGSIKDQAGNDASIASLSVPSPGGVNITTREVTLNSVRAQAGSYGVGAVLELEAVFSEPVSVTGIPELKLSFLEGAPSSASYVRGDGSDTLIFSYTVSAGENDNDGIEVTELILASAGIVNEYGFAVAALSSFSLEAAVIVDTKAPEFQGLTDLSMGSVVSSKTWSWDCSDVSTPCSYRYTFNKQSSNHQFTQGDVYGTDVTADTPNGENGPWFLHIQAKDGVDNESAVFSYGVNLDGAPPFLASGDIGVPTAKTYNNQMDFTVTFSENVTVDTTNGLPRLTLTVGTETRHANYDNGSGGSVLTFRYVIQVGDVDDDGIDLVSVIDLNGGTIKDGVQNVFDATATLQIPLLSGVKVSKTMGVSISKTGLAIGEKGGIGTYTVVLDRLPLAAVRITVSGTDGVTVSPATLDFAVGDWSTTQEVTVKGVDDKIDNDPVRTATISHAVSATGGYAGVTAASVKVTLTDDDTKGITVSAVTSSSIAEDGGEATYSVVLNSEPTATVTVTPIGVTGKVSVSGVLTFTSNNWDDTQDVTVTGINDDVVNSPVRTPTITHEVSETGGYTGVSAASVSVTLTDDDTKGITVSAVTSSSIAEDGGEATYSVVLNSEPTATVTVTPIGVTGKVLVSGVLTFTSNNWDDTQDVTVTGINDDVVNSPVRTATITHEVSETGGYTGVSAASVTVTLTDDDTKGITVVSPSNFAVLEKAGTGTYTVVLNSEPTGDVEVTPVGVTDKVKVSGVLTFTSNNWDDTQEVTVTGINDDIDNVSDRMATIAHTLSAPGTDYASGVTVADVSVTLTDDDTKGITVVSPSNFAVLEKAGTGTYTVVLNSEPTGDVEVTPVGVTDKVKVSGVLTFTSNNWDDTQEVTVTGINDDIDNVSDRMATIAHTLSAPGTDYASGVTVADVSVTLTDDDMKGITVSETDIIVTEAIVGGGNEVTYTLKLNSEPSGRVEVTVTSGDTDVASVSGTLTFTSGDWDTAQEVTVTGVDDDIDSDSDRATTISHTVSAPGTDYASVTVASVSVTLTDDDTKGITVLLPIGPLVVREKAGTGAYQVVLNSQPTEDVTITVTSGDTDVVTVAATLGDLPLTFTPANWNKKKWVTVTGVNDNIFNSPNRRATITHRVSETGGYTGVTAASVSVALTDDENRGVTVSPTGLTLTEATGGSNTGTYDVVLDSEPTGGNVTITVTSGDTDVVTVAATLGDLPLTFTSDNWDTPQEVTVTGVDDNTDQAKGYKLTSIENTPAGADYEGLRVSDVVVKVIDDDATIGNVTIEGGPLTIDENAGIATYTVVLKSEPTGDVTVTPGEVAGKVLVSGAFTFSTSNWSTPKTVTVTGVDDDIFNSPNRTATITHAIAGGGYASESVPDVEVTLTDDELGVVITGRVGPLNGDIPLRIAFSESVNDFVKTDIMVSSGSLGTLSAQSNNGIFNITLTPDAGTDTVVTVDIPADRATSTASGSGNTAADRYSVKVDNVLPELTSTDIVVPGDKNYVTGEHLDFLVSFNEAVLVVGSPELHMWMGAQASQSDESATNKDVVYESGSGSAILTFRYTIVGADADTDGINLSDKFIHGDVSNNTIKDLAGNDFTLVNANEFVLGNKHLTGVTVNKPAKNNLALQDRVVSPLSAEQTPALAFDPAQIEGLGRWLDGADSNTLFSDLFCSTPLGAGEGPPGCWSDKSGRGGHYFPVPAMEWPTLLDVLATEAERKSGELFAVTDREGKVNLLSFLYPHPHLEEETFHNRGEIREVVIYEEPLGESERGELEEYLTCRWQLPSATENCL